MTARRIDALSSVEKEAIATIRAWRLSSDHEARRLLQALAHLMHSVIGIYHGHVKLRLGPIAAELGVEIRSLERGFVDEFGKTMLEHQTETRLAFSKAQLCLKPRPKLSVIANLLGYEDVRGWARFFKQHVGESPSAWSRSVVGDKSHM